MKSAASLWKSSTRKYQDGWVEHANNLNKIPLPGYLKKLPRDIFFDGIEYKVKLSLQSDWIFVVKRLTEMIIKTSERHNSSLKYKFGK